MSSLILRARISLLDQDRSAAPCQMPVQHWLAQARQKGNRAAAVEDLVEWTIQNALAAEPVVPVAERLDAVRAGQVGLRLARLGKP